jgi:nucleotide-binding universal stress UspA family protein
MMYRRILIALDTTKDDAGVLAHIGQLVADGSPRIVLIHVADGWAARHFETLKLVESEEMKADRAYLEKCAAEMRSAGFEVEVLLACGDPPAEILKAAADHRCDLIAMSSHGHRFLADMVLGSTIEAVRHRAAVPLLIVPATPQPAPQS